MSKYAPLAEHLRALRRDRVRLAFAEVEAIIGSVLPPSARKHDAWWSNSRTSDSHTWAHMWLRAGWERARLHLTEEWVEFRRWEYYELDSVKAFEGYESDRRILSRARNAALALRRKTRDGHACQACGLKLCVGGKHVIEVHHLEPLSNSGRTETSIDQLVSLCPTCHRIAHLRSTPFTVHEIREILERREAGASSRAGKL